MPSLWRPLPILVGKKRRDSIVLLPGGGRCPQVRGPDKERVLLYTCIFFIIVIQSGQFDWMLRTLLEIYENHPPEDVSVTALAVFGLLKASAILKCVRMFFKAN